MTTSSHDNLIIRANTESEGNYELNVTPERAGWGYSGLKIIALEANESETFDTGIDEIVIVPLEGSCTVEVDGTVYELAGRENVFADITDYIFVPYGKTVTLKATSKGRYSVSTARANQDMELETTYCDRNEVRVEFRGTGNCSRQVNNYALGNNVKTSHVLVVEVITPGGNWSSYPPHKHDEHNSCERVLEEIYYFEITAAPDGTPGFALHRTYGSPGKPIDICIELRDRDVVLTPHGYHGPCAAAPGYDLYYLNVMAGPGDVPEWLMTDDPQHTWIRSTWADQPVDPRLQESARKLGIQI